MQPNDTIKLLLAEIDEHIDLCDGKITPVLCGMRGNQREQMLSLIYEIVVKEGVSISAAMAKIEESFSLNSPE